MSKTNAAVVIAYDKGYRVTPAGVVVNRVGKIRKLQIKSKGNDKRFTFTVNTGGGEIYPVMVHQLVAYQKFGRSTFEKGIVVRHLDGDSFNNKAENIALGSISENAFDRLPEDRQAHARKAGKAASPHTDEFWKTIKEEHASGVSYKKLRAKYGISLSTLSYQLSKTGKYITLENRK